MKEQNSLAVLRDDSCVTIVGMPIMDYPVVAGFKEAIKAAVDSSVQVVVDLRTAVYIDSSILQSMAASNRRMRDEGRRLRILVMEGSHPLRVFTLLGFCGLMDVVACPRAQGRRQRTRRRLPGFSADVVEDDD